MIFTGNMQEELQSSRREGTEISQSSKFWLKNIVSVPFFYEVVHMICMLLFAIYYYNIGQCC